MIEKHIRMNLTLPESIANELSQIAAELNDKKSRIVAKALELYFDELDGQIAEQRLKELESGKTELIDAEVVWKELGI
ncbi:MAG TPA: CopG family transcriptional regulator [Candidatus Cloacimonetes bacterium]|nr:CopG family transcriptional regulator [Candidatus Cloacimonadota bacterium]